MEVKPVGGLKTVDGRPMQPVMPQQPKVKGLQVHQLKKGFIYLDILSAHPFLYLGEGRGKMYNSEKGRYETIKLLDRQAMEARQFEYGE